MTFPEPDDGHGDDPQGAVLLATFVVAGSEGAEVLGPGKGVLDRVAQAVGGAVEGATTVLGALVGDGVANAVTAAQRANGPAVVPLVAHNPVRAYPWSSPAGPADGALGEQAWEDRCLVALPRREHHR